MDDPQEDEEVDEGELRRKAAEATQAAERTAARVAADGAEQARQDEEEAARQKQNADRVARIAAEEEENKAATRLKRIKQLIAEKKGFISSNLRDSLREIVKKYPTTKAAEEAKKLLED